MDQYSKGLFTLRWMCINICTPSMQFFWRVFFFIFFYIKLCFGGAYEDTVLLSDNGWSEEKSKTVSLVSVLLYLVLFDRHLNESKSGKCCLTSSWQAPVCVFIVTHIMTNISHSKLNTETNIRILIKKKKIQIDISASW